MGFGKAFGIGLVIFIALNFVWVLIMDLLAGGLTIFNNFTDIGAILGIFFGGVAFSPTLAIMELLLTPAIISSIPSEMLPYVLPILGIDSVEMMSFLLRALYYIVPAMVTAIIIGRLATKVKAFFAMFLIMIISGVLLMIAVLMLNLEIYSGFLGLIFYMFTMMSGEGGGGGGGNGMLAMIGVLIILIGAVVNSIFYGGIAAVSAKKDD